MSQMCYGKILKRKSFDKILKLLLKYYCRWRDAWEDCYDDYITKYQQQSIKVLKLGTMMKVENILCKILSIFPSDGSIVQTILAKNVKLFIAVGYKYINKF